MIIVVGAVAVSAITSFVAYVKNQKTEAELNTEMDFNMGLQEDNRVLNTCLDTLANELEQKKKDLTQLQAELKDVKAVKTNTESIEKDVETVGFWKKQAESLTWQRDLEKKCASAWWAEKESYKKMYEAELNKKAPQ